MDIKKLYNGEPLWMDGPGNNVLELMMREYEQCIKLKGELPEIEGVWESHLFENCSVCICKESDSPLRYSVSFGCMEKDEEEAVRRMPEDTRYLSRIAAEDCLARLVCSRKG